MRAMVVKFRREPGLGAIWATLLCVQRADRDVQGGVRVAEGGSEDVSGPEVSARALGHEEGGEEFTQMSISRVTQTWLLVGREVTESFWCCHSVQAETSRKCVRSAATRCCQTC